MRVAVDSAAMRDAFDRVKSDPVFAESAALVSRGGKPVEMLQALSMSPGLLEGFAAVSRGVYPGGLVEREVKEIIILEASRRNQCQFCTSSHVAMCRMMGMADDPIALLDSPGDMSLRQQLARELTQAVMEDSNNVSDALFERLGRAFSQPEIVELVFMVGFINCLNLFNNTLGNRYNDEYTVA